MLFPEKKIVMVVDAAPPLYGGAGQQALLLADHLERELGYPIEIWSRRRRPSLHRRYQRVVMVGPYVRSEPLSHLLFSVAVFFRLLFTRVAAVHVHGAFYYGFTAIAAARLKRVSSILKMTLLGVDDPRAVSNLRLAGVAIGKIVALQFRWATYVIALNDEAVEAAHAYDARLRIVKIPNGIVPPNDVRDRREDNNPRVIFTGVMSRRKGIDTLLDAWSAFKLLHPDATLTLAGPEGDAAIDFSHTEHLSIVQVGLLGREELSAALAHANMFVLPSRAEGLPNSAIEAMSYGLPVVLSDIAVNQSTAQDAAMYFRAGEADSLATTLIEAWALRDELGKRSYAQSQRYDISLVARMYSRVYNSFLEKSRSEEELRHA